MLLNGNKHIQYYEYALPPTKRSLQAHLCLNQGHTPTFFYNSA